MCSIASATATVFPSVATPVGVPFADSFSARPVLGSTRQTALSAAFVTQT